MIAPDGVALLVDVENDGNGIQFDTSLAEKNDKLTFGVATNYVTILLWLFLLWIVCRHSHHGGAAVWA
jgi:hypothetical protein